MLLQEAKSKGFQIVVIDDGSDKALHEIFASAAWFGTVLHHGQNMGKGQAIKTGLSYIQDHFPADCIIVTMDTDGQHRAADAQKICQAAQDHPDTLVLGSRKLREHVPVWKYSDQIRLSYFHRSEGMGYANRPSGIFCQTDPAVS